MLYPIEIITVDKLHIRELHSFFTATVEHQSTSQIYFGKLFSK